jgi:hypothetical protein
MTYEFVKLDGMLCEFKIYDSKVNFEKLFNELTEDNKNDILNLTLLHFNFLREQLNMENTTSISITLDSVKKIEKIPIKVNICVTKNFKYINIVNGNQQETTKISVNICLPSYENVAGVFEMYQNIYLVDFDLNNDDEFKKYLYNILFYAYILIRDFKFHPMLRYLNHKDDINNLVDIKQTFIRLYGDTNECSVCLEPTITYTICNHCLCQKCYSQLQEKVCPSCRADLIDEDNFGYEDINLEF